MKVKIEKKSLEDMLFKVSKSIGNNKDITECILLYTSNQGLHMEGNNYVIAVQTYEPAQIIKHGQILINGSIFTQIVKKMPVGEILLEQKQAELLIKMGKLKYLIAINPDVEQFSKIYLLDMESKYSINAADLINAVKGTIFAVNPKDPKIMMRGMHLIWKAGGLQITATNGFCVARRILPSDCQEEQEYIIPGQSLLELTRVVAPEDTIVLQHFDKKISFRFNNTIFVSNLIDGRYYSLDQILETDPMFSIQVSKKMLLETLERSSLLKRVSDRQPVVFQFEDNKELSVSIQTPTGSLQEDIPFSGAARALRIGMNERFVIDVLKSIDSNDITLHFTGCKSPLIIKDQLGAYANAILPVNLG